MKDDVDMIIGSNKTLDDILYEFAQVSKNNITPTSKVIPMVKADLSRHYFDVVCECLPKNNPYPEDIFIPMTKEQLKEDHELLQIEMHIPLDRLSGEIGRRVWAGHTEEIKQSLKQKLEVKDE